MVKRAVDKPGLTDAQQKRAKRYQSMVDRVRNPHSAFEISPGMKGFFVTCNRNREKKSATEVIDLLEEYAAKIYPGLAEEIENEDDEDADENEAEAASGNIEDEIAREVAGIKSKSKPKLFRYLNATIDCLVFIKCHRMIDPEKMVQFIFDDLTKTMQRKTRFTSRLIPAKVTTTSKLDAIVKGSAEVAKNLLAEDAEPTTFALVVNIRYCDDLKRDEVIRAVAGPLDVKHKVDLTNAKYTLVIEAFKSMCTIGLVENYNARKRLNLQTLFDEPAVKNHKASEKDPIDQIDQDGNQADNQNGAKEKAGSKDEIEQNSTS
ncbi:hypothetical protein J3B02_002226 [Coemansia erecta]|uniref:THUMP domain-containing protein n=1 Tax=Coemansia asiatica TaxID=1052880 RepID=A0A9W8CM91_9FUNG|nr:hypothetical protein LPJ64_000619 [Coemansia asiatica]KAJ2855330.1 hypothetical protein J3B02_002226 [Coemansia erecta]